MSPDPAPFHGGLAEGPPGGFARWLRASDGVRLRAGFWPLEGAGGTVCILPGRTEYIEKYGRVAAGLAARGFAAMAIDWRGQGLADRLLADRAIGHVRRFADYQRDLDAALALAAELLPGPRFMLAHSMGGCIGLRALSRGVAFGAVAFSAPMWGIPLPNNRPGLTRTLLQGAVRAGMAARYAPAPATGPESYVATAPFDDNTLTGDRDHYDWMKAHLAAVPDLLLAGPSLGWLSAALDECHALGRPPSPALPALTFLGSREQVVDPAPIRARMARWPGGELVEVEGARHEILMERPETRTRFLDAAAALFAA